VTAIDTLTFGHVAVVSDVSLAGHFHGMGVVDSTIISIPNQGKKPVQRPETLRS
jgi:hypothetical protein